MLTYRACTASAIAIVVTVLAAGCQPVILIAKPDRNNPGDPVTSVVVNFTSNFKPAEPWYVDLDGTNLTGFSPAPVPGGTSSVPVTITTCPAHKVTAQGTCGTFCSYQSDTVSFTVPAFMYNSITCANGFQNLKVFQPANVFVGIQNYPSSPITITVQETTLPRHVKLATSTGPFQNPGNPITLTIGAPNTKADFRIEGDVLGNYALQFTSGPGTIAGVGGGTISP
jgi:hypothetical protein